MDSAGFFPNGTWLEQCFRATEPFGADGGDVATKPVAIECFIPITGGIG